MRSERDGKSRCAVWAMPTGHVGGCVHGQVPCRQGGRCAPRCGAAVQLARTDAHEHTVVGALCKPKARCAWLLPPTQPPCTAARKTHATRTQHARNSRAQHAGANGEESPRSGMRGAAGSGAAGTARWGAWRRCDGCLFGWNWCLLELVQSVGSCVFRGASAVGLRVRACAPQHAWWWDDGNAAHGAVGFWTHSHA